MNISTDSGYRLAVEYQGNQTSMKAETYAAQVEAETAAVALFQSNPQITKVTILRPCVEYVSFRVPVRFLVA